MLGGYISFAVTANITISNNFINFYTYGGEDQPTIGVGYYTVLCNLQDDVLQTLLVANNHVERDNFPTMDLTSIVA